MAPQRCQKFEGRHAALLSRLDNASGQHTCLPSLPSIPKTAKRPPMPEIGPMSPIKIRFPCGGEESQAWKGFVAEDVVPMFCSPRWPVAQLQPIGAEADVVPTFCSPRRPVAQLQPIGAEAYSPSSLQPIKPIMPVAQPPSPTTASWGQKLHDAQYPGSVPRRLDDAAIPHISPKTEDEAATSKRGTGHNGPIETPSHSYMALKSEIEKIGQKLNDAQYPSSVPRQLDDTAIAHIPPNPPPPPLPPPGDNGPIEKPSHSYAYLKQRLNEFEKIAHLQPLGAEASSPSSHTRKAAQTSAEAPSLTQLPGGVPRRLDDSFFARIPPKTEEKTATKKGGTGDNGLIQTPIQMPSYSSRAQESQIEKAQLKGPLSRNLQDLPQAPSDAADMRNEYHPTAPTGGGPYHPTAPTGGGPGFVRHSANFASSVSPNADGGTPPPLAPKAPEAGVDGQELSRAEVFLWKESLINDAYAAIEHALVRQDLLSLRAALVQARVAGMTDRDRILVVQEFTTRGSNLEVLLMRNAFDAWTESLLVAASMSPNAGGGTPPPLAPQKQVDVSDVCARESKSDRERAALLQELAVASELDCDALKAAVERARSAGLEGEEVTNAETAIKKMEASQSLNNTLNKSIEASFEIASIGSAHAAEHLDGELDVLRGALQDARASGVEGLEIAAAEDFLYHEEKRAEAAADLRDAAATGDPDILSDAISKAREAGVDGQELSRAEVFLWKESLIKDAYAAIEHALIRQDLLSLRAALVQARVAGMTDRDRILVVQEFTTRGYTLELLQMRNAFDAWTESLLVAAFMSPEGSGFQMPLSAPVEEKPWRQEKWALFAHLQLKNEDATQLLREDLIVAVRCQDANRIRRAVLRAANSGLKQDLIQRIVLDVKESHALVARGLNGQPMTRRAGAEEFSRGQGKGQGEVKTEVMSAPQELPHSSSPTAAPLQQLPHSSSPTAAPLQQLPHSSSPTAAPLQQLPHSSSPNWRRPQQIASSPTRKGVRRAPVPIDVQNVEQVASSKVSPSSPSLPLKYPVLPSAVPIDVQNVEQVASSKQRETHSAIEAKIQTMRVENGTLRIQAHRQQANEATPASKHADEPTPSTPLACDAANAAAPDSTCADVGINPEDPHQKLAVLLQSDDSARRVRFEDPHRELTAALHSGDSARVRVAVDAVQAAGSTSREVEVLALALRGNASVDPSAIAVAAMSLAGCGVRTPTPVRTSTEDATTTQVRATQIKKEMPKAILDSPNLSQDSQKKPVVAKAEIQPGQYQQGQELEYNSISNKKWIPCKVLAVREDGAIQVNVKEGQWMDADDQSAKLRLKNGAQLSKYGVSDPAKRIGSDSSHRYERGLHQLSTPPPSMYPEPEDVRVSTPDRQNKYLTEVHLRVKEAKKDLADAKTGKDVEKLRSAIDHAKQLGVKAHHIMEAEKTIDDEERKKQIEKDLAMAMWGGDMEYLAKLLDEAREIGVSRSAIGVAENILDKERALQLAQDDLAAAVNSKDPVKIQECLAVARAAGVPKIRIAVAERALQAISFLNATSGAQCAEEELVAAIQTRDSMQLRTAVTKAARAGVDAAKIAAATWALRDILAESTANLNSLLAKVSDGSADESSDLQLLDTAVARASRDLGSGNDEDSASLVAAIEAAQKVLARLQGKGQADKELLN